MWRRTGALALLADLACVLVFVAVGTRNHDTDTGLTGVLFVAAPFWIAAVFARAVPVVRRASTSMSAGIVAWVATVAVGMALRGTLFDRGTAGAFVVVATVFLGATMLGWRTAANWRSND